MAVKKCPCCNFATEQAKMHAKRITEIAGKTISASQPMCDVCWSTLIRNYQKQQEFLVVVVVE